LIMPIVLALGVWSLSLVLTSTDATTAAPAAPTPASSCVPSLEKSVSPSTVSLGGSVEASLVVSATCAAKLVPVDLIIVADESFSMTRGSTGGGGTRAPTPTPPGPRQTPMPGLPTREPEESDEPAFCNVNDNEIVTRTPTPRPRRRTPTPGPRPTEEEEQSLEPAGTEDLIRDEKTWIRDLLDLSEVQRDLASDRLRIGFVSFSGDVRSKAPLTNDPGSITSAAGRMRGSDLTHVNEGMSEAGKMLTGAGSRADAGDRNRVQIVVLLSDFQFCKRDMRLGGAAGSDVQVITVAFGREYHVRNHLNMASERNFALQKSELPELINLYETVLAPPRPVAIRQTTVRDQLADNMRLIPGSVNPPTVTITGQLLEWQLGALPQRLTYAVEPQAAGIHPLSVSASASWTDSLGLAGSAPFPDVQVEVLAVTATPTPTFTPTPIPTHTPTPRPTHTPTSTATYTPTPTPSPAPVYLPIAYRNWPEPLPTAVPTACVPEEQTIDVALVIDTSNSMRDPTQAGGQRKIDAAIEAAIEIVTLLKATDQATIVGFNATATVAAELTGDKARLEAALRSLANSQAGGTEIDTGLRAGSQELQSARHRPGNKSSIILVTDGAQSGGDTQPVRDAANAAKSAGITVVTVGLGAEVDEPLLREVASDPTLFFKAPNAEDLVRIYREVARLIPCP